MSSLISELPQRLFGNKSPVWVRWAIIMAVLVGAAYLGPRASTLMILGLLIIIFILVILHWPKAGLVALLVSSFLIQYEIGTGTKTTISLSMLILVIMIGIWGVNMLVQQRQIRLYPSRVIPPLVGFAVVAVLAFLVGQLPWFNFATQVSLAAQLGGLMIFLLSAGTFLWIAHQAQDVKWLEWSVWIYLGFALFFLVGEYVIPGQIWTIIPISARGGMFWVWTVALSASQLFFNKSLRPAAKWALALILILALIYTLKNSAWASGWVPSLTVLVVVIFLYNFRLGLLAGVVGAIGFLIYNPNIINQVLAQDAYSLFTRQAAWQIVLGNIVKVNPLLGLGPANYYNYTPLFSLLGYNLRFNSHNQYVDIIAQIGILGMFFFAWFAFECARVGWKLKGSAPAGFQRAFVMGALAGLAGTLVSGMLGDWVIPFVYNVGMAGFRSSMFAWLFLGGLVVIERLVNQALVNQAEAGDAKEAG